jgi:peptide/nickel transport system permease protein
MLEYIVKRIFAMVPTILGITVVTFLIIQLAPGNPAEFKVRMASSGALDPQYTAQIIEQTRKLYGLDKPLHVRYLIWIKQVVHFDFGHSYKDHRPVRDKILERVPISLQLELISLLVVYIISVPLGVFSAVKQDTLGDKIVTIGLFILYSLPSFWVAMMLITFLGGGEFLSIFPVYGLSSEGASSLSWWPWLIDRIHHLVLPVVCLSYMGLAYISRQMRGGMLEVIRQDYIRTARAKGLSEKVVVFKHALRNSLIPIITMLAVLFPALIGGSVIIEYIFSIPGMGLLSFDAILSRDYPVIMGITTTAAILTLMGILCADLTYTLVDPRITFSSEGLSWSWKGLAAVLLIVLGALGLSGAWYYVASLPGWGEQLKPLAFAIFIRGLIAGIAASILYTLFVIGRDRLYWAMVLRQFARKRLALGALMGIAGLALIALLAPLLANNKPLYMRWQGKTYFPALREFLPADLKNNPDLRNVIWDDIAAGTAAVMPESALFPPVRWSPLQIDMGQNLKGPSGRHWLGTDDTNRDLLGRIIHGTRIALTVGFVAVGIYIWIGVVLGSLAGYYGGWVDMIISRLIEVMQSIPTFFLIIAVVAFLEPSIYNVMAAIGFVGWTGTARLVRGEFLKLRTMQFVEASRSQGAGDLRIIFRHMLPNALTPVLVVATFGVADAILVESSLSFLGFGVQPPTPSWGDILSKARSYYDIAWWITLFPGMAIFATITLLNLVGEGFRDAIDPRLKGKL